jgi:hypothetical protein
MEFVSQSVSWDNIVSTVTGCELRSRVSIPGGGRDFLFTTMSVQFPGPTQPLIQ